LNQVIAWPGSIIAHPLSDRPSFALSSLRGGSACTLSGLGYNPRQHGEAQRKESGSEKVQTQIAEGARSAGRETAERRSDSDRDPAGARGTRNAIGSGIARAGWPLTKRRGLPHLQPSPIGGFAWRAAAARSVDEPRSAHRTYAYATFLALERTQGCAARLSRGQLLDTSRLVDFPVSFLAQQGNSPGGHGLSSLSRRCERYSL